MKKLLLPLLLAFPFMASAQQEVTTDSISNTLEKAETSAFLLHTLYPTAKRLIETA